jgi:dTDP-4-dehydrorhamnose 3,5-epimerase-like enzyme
MIGPYKKTLKPIKTENKCGLLYWDNLFDQFDTKRIFYLQDCDDLNETNNMRGKHINKDCNEILVLLQGELIITLIDMNDPDPDIPMETRATYKYECNKNDYVHIPLNYYLEIEILTKNTVYFVLCDNIC